MIFTHHLTRKFSNCVSNYCSPVGRNRGFSKCRRHRAAASTKFCSSRSNPPRLRHWRLCRRPESGARREFPSSAPFCRPNGWRRPSIDSSREDRGVDRSRRALPPQHARERRRRRRLSTSRAHDGAFGATRAAAGRVLARAGRVERAARTPRVSRPRDAERARRVHRATRARATRARATRARRRRLAL